jgi:hypothetical protein
LKESGAMRVIEIKQHGNSWKVFEAPGVKPVFLKKDQPTSYAEDRPSFRYGQVRIFDSFVDTND